MQKGKIHHLLHMIVQKIKQEAQSPWSLIWYVVEMVGRTLKKGVRMEGRVGDDDTTAITRINEELDPNIQKHSDKNHVKRTLQIPCTIF